MKKTIGILGGMGPLATCDLMRKIIDHTEAANDQEHIHICVDSNTNIPDRTAAILYDGSNPLPEMIKSAVRLQSMGADVLIIPCNTAHFYLEEIRKYIDIPILSMLQETANYLHNQGVQRAAILATDGTIQCGLYDAVLVNSGISPMHPSEKEQKLIMSIIYDCVKAGKVCFDIQEIYAMEKHLSEQGAQVMILGCTELPVAFAQWENYIPVVDPTDILAMAAIRYAGGRVKES